MSASFQTAPRREAMHAGTRAFRDDVHAGLSRRQKTLPAKYFYDLEGSRLFEDITRLPEYYPTRTELRILRDNAPAIADLCPAGAAVVEFGAGSSEKIRQLLPALRQAAAYVPIDVSGEFLNGEAEGLRADLPEVEVIPVVADFTQDFALPAAISGRPRVGFFPGSTIGNFEPPAAQHLLRTFADLLGPEAVLIVGIDRVKGDDVLNAAYDDGAGTTARFNLNLLVRINRELGADFDLPRFTHRAFFNRALGRIEMHLVSAEAQAVSVAGKTFAFGQGETIHTENSYKYSPESFSALLVHTGWSVDRMFTDAEGLFSVFVLRTR